MALGVSVVAIALWRGGREERLGGLAVAFQALNEHVAWLRWSIGWPADVVALAVFLPMVLVSRRWWTVWALASVALSLVTDVIDALVRLSRWSYLSAELTWYYVLLAALTWGVLSRVRSPSSR